MSSRTSAHPDPHPFQTPAWGKFYQRIGHKIIRRKISERGIPSYTVQALIQKSALKDCFMAYVPRSHPPSVKQIAFLKDIARKHSCLSIKIEPDFGWWSPLSPKDQAQKKALDASIRSQKGIPSHNVYSQRTMIISLKEPTETLLMKMHQKTRYNIRLSQRKGVLITRDNSKECFEKFLKLFFEDTLQRTNIDFPHSPKTLRIFWQSMKNSGMLHLLKASYLGETIAVMMLLKKGKRLYYPHGASSRIHKNAMASFGLMWRAMQFGKKLGCSSLDLWGIGNESEGNVTESSVQNGGGLFRFYSGFGAKTFERLGAYDFINK